MKEEGAMRSWAEELELENQLYTSQLNHFERNRAELNLKKLILTEIMVSHRDDSTYNSETFKAHFRLDQIAAKLKHLQSEEQVKMEEELLQKLYYNTLVLDRIKTISR
ncbi:hypothetical protein [Planomicrobium sp. CPCC 101079]|uniref:hypothetical protein n=1 Tax=Planomicrobium sp. CPCC 101079 TaxID=2599618 RepID=UPI0011B46939|nr:hypothetical protein [Planomicrobium sp. CPCC 101079]TWT13178.1 hypothetical protein FQV28_03305 [Planomicrobium sp. CPCC 101079]